MNDLLPVPVLRLWLWLKTWNCVLRHGQHWVTQPPPLGIACFKCKTYWNVVDILYIAREQYGEAVKRNISRSGV